MSNTANTQMTSRWQGGIVPYGVSWAKLMMWIFLLTDAFTFGTFLTAYGFFRARSANWPDPETVFQSFPFIAEHGLPLVFVGLMTFILIASSLTMVLAVEAGHRNEKKTVTKYLLLTILGGIAFLACQAYEWTHLITEGTTLSGNPFGDAMFGQLFFTITGFHGFHVLSGVVINSIMWRKARTGSFERKGNYEAVEIAGLYWHFVDLVWVFVFTLFYLI